MKKYRVLSLDGGGSKGVYTLGVLKELEKMLGGKLCEHFDLIYGTSTGSIIASLIALGEKVEDVEKKYFELVPKIMSGNGKKNKSRIFKEQADKIFGEKKFDEFVTNIGIVAMNYDEQKPFIFKNDIRQAYGMKQSFENGFGCLISDAVQASCAAYPIFEVKVVETINQGTINAIDGGFIANNPSLFALIDSYKAIGIDEKDISLLSIGVGRYVEKSMGWKYKILNKFKIAQFVERVLSANATTNETLAQLIFSKVQFVRINDTFNQPEYGTNMVEMDVEKLKKLSQLGRSSYAKYEQEILKFFEKTKEARI